MNRDLSSGPGAGSGGIQGDNNFRAAFIQKLQNDRLNAQKEGAIKGTDNEASVAQDSIINAPIKTASKPAPQDPVENKRSFTILGTTFELPRAFPSFSSLGNVFSQALNDIGTVFASATGRSDSPATNRSVQSQKPEPVLQKAEGTLHQYTSNIFREQITQEAVLIPEKDLASIPSVQSPKPEPVLQKAEETLHQYAANILREQITQEAVLIPEDAPDVGQAAAAGVNLSPEEKAQKKLSFILKEIVSTEHNHAEGLRELKTALNTFLLTVQPPHKTINIQWKIPPSKDEPLGKELLESELIQYVETYEKAYNASQKFEDKIQQKIVDKGGDVGKLTTEDILEVYNDDKIFPEYVETMKDATAIMTKLGILRERIDFAKTFPHLNEDSMISTGGKIHILSNKPVFTMQRLPRHVMLLQDLLKTTNEANNRKPDAIDDGPLGQTLLKVQEAAKYLNVESGILSDKGTLKDVNRSLDKIIEVEQKESRQSLLKSIQPIPRRLLNRQETKQTPNEITKVLKDIEKVSISSDQQIRESSRGLLNKLERSSKAMKAIRKDEALMKTYQEVSSNTFKDLLAQTFKDFELLSSLLAQKKQDGTKSLILDENDNLVLRDITGTKPEETLRAFKKAEEILKSATGNSKILLDVNSKQIDQAAKNSESEKRLLIEKDLLLQTIENMKKVDALLRDFSS